MPQAYLIHLHWNACQTFPEFVCWEGRNPAKYRPKKIKINTKKNIQHQILQTTKVNIIWQTIRRITNAILGVKGLSWLLLQNLSSQDLDA